VDNVCHTLVGAACARAGLTRPTRFAAATSMIAANLPDVDVLVFFTDVPSVAFRRGWTHGPLAQAFLPAVLAAVMVLAGRRLAAKDGGADPPAFVPLAILSYVGVSSHVFLDYLNNYGVRLLMPFSGRWFYGDTLFIIDPWLWLLLGAAVMLRPDAGVRTARVFLAVAMAYIVCMMASARAAETAVLDAWRQDQGTLRSLMVGPTPFDPLTKTVIIDTGTHYRTGTFTRLPRRLTLSGRAVAKNDDHPATLEARGDPRIAGILVWARFPVWEIITAPDGLRVSLHDMRFGNVRRGGFAASTVVR
jgi:inner membrane protein